MMDDPQQPAPPVTQPFPPIADLLKRKGIWLKKSRSQHFLRSQEICAGIAELTGIDKGGVAVEVGAGLGNLTVELAARAGKVLSVELDQAFADWHEYLAAQYPGLEFLYRDFLQVNLAAEIKRIAPNGEPLYGVGNLPYQITSQILFAFLESKIRFERLVFMVQKEVAERIAVGSESRAAGALSYKIALRYRTEVAMVIPPEAFLPPPRVWSAVLVLEPLATPLVANDTEFNLVSHVVDQLFLYRRKTLLNGLIMGGIVPGREAASALLLRAGIDEKRRPETLSLDELIRLSRESQLA